MGYSLNFDGNDMADYNLVVNSPGDNPYGQIISTIQLQDRGYPFRPQREPRRIAVRFEVTGTSRANLDSNLDSIKRILTRLIVKKLIFDTLSGRYFHAILERFEGSYETAVLFRGTMRFICPDPVSYSITETSSDYNIDADPKTVNEIVGGSAFLLPVYTLVAGEALSGVTIQVENLTTDEELVWVGTLAITEVLIIDCVRWLVTKESIADMAAVTGKFPRLQPNTTNDIKVTGFSTTGTLNITYREAYL